MSKIISILHSLAKGYTTISRQSNADASHN
jgi:hypothetical protein